MPISYAKWKRIPARGRIAEIRWNLRKVSGWQWASAALVFAFCIAMQIERLQRGRTSVPFTLLWLPIYGTMIYSMLVVFSIGRQGRFLANRLRVKSATDVYPVLMTVLRDDKPLGQSEGWVTFGEGVLRFEGEMTSFVLNPADVFAPTKEFAEGPLIRNDEHRWRFGNLRDKIAWGFLLAEHPDVRVNFFPLKARGFPSIYGPLFAWLQRRSLDGGETVLPPVDPQPGYRSPSLSGWKKTKAV